MISIAPIKRKNNTAHYARRPDGRLVFFLFPSRFLYEGFTLLCYPLSGIRNEP